MSILVRSIIWFFLFYVTGFRLVSSKIDIIKDDNMRFWFKYSYAFTSGGEQWNNPSQVGTDYSSTESSKMGSDFWLITKHIDFGANTSDHVYVDMTTIDMSGSLEVYLYLNSIKPSIPVYKKAEDKETIHNYLTSNFRLVFDHTYTGQTPKPYNAVKRFAFHRNGSEGVTFGIRANSATGKLLKLKIYYYYCNGRFINSARFSKTFAPDFGFTEVQGSCSQNSAMAGNNGAKIRGFCSENGTWLVNDTRECLCREGYEPNQEHGCLACQANHFKEAISNTGCLTCPLNTESRENKTICRCKDGYYRLDEEINSTLSPCYARLKMNNVPNVKKLNNKTAKITWNIPNKTDDLNDTITFEVQCFSCKGIVCKDPCVKVTFEPSAQDLAQPSVLVSNLKVGEKYEFRVYPKNMLNKKIPKSNWNYSKVDYIHLIEISVPHTMPVTTINRERKKASATETGFPLYIVLVAVACLLFMVVAFLVALILRRKRMEKKFAGSLLQNAVELPNVGQRTYIDPTNYESPEAALGEFAKELEPTLIKADMLIGGGEFGDVYKGKLSKTEDHRVNVAIKTLKPDVSPKSEKDFLLEASIMGQFDHPNVVRLEGVVTKNFPRMIVLEFMANGSLDNFLKVNDGRLSQVQLITMAKGIASGMEYLSRMNYVHRDLAARNILVGETMVCKVSDFGLSRHLETTDSSRGEYSTSGGRIPMRWTAPEAIKYRKFSSASDVWSFGILLWEIMSFAERPYWEWDNFVVVEKVDNGYRLPAPLNCPKGVHDLMLHCWKQDRAERPNFTSITTVIDTWLETADTMNEDLASMTLLGQWLKRLKMGNYISIFAASGYDKPSQVMDMTDDRLKEMGVMLVGHRNKILKGIKVLKEMQKRREFNREVSLEV